MAMMTHGSSTNSETWTRRLGRRRSSIPTLLSTLKRQLLAADLCKILAQLKFLAQSQIALGICSFARHLSRAQAFSHLCRDQLPLQGSMTYVESFLTAFSLSFSTHA